MKEPTLSIVGDMRWRLINETNFVDAFGAGQVGASSLTEMYSLPYVSATRCSGCPRRAVHRTRGMISFRLPIVLAASLPQWIHATALLFA
jgi:hypothetical protein